MTLLFSQLTKCLAITTTVVLLLSIASADEPVHWAYVKPERAGLPDVTQQRWPENAVDRFVLARIEAAGLKPSEEADRATLVRRLYFDLVGLPPSIEDVEQFLADDAPGAYERLVDRLLASPQYGEKWARGWLDLARYADSNGFQRDGHRTVWPYRDWVIGAMNADMPFDQFTIEQNAGDLLPDATLDQQIATGFHRCTTVNVEAGTDQEEDRVNAVIDRVNTTGTVWLGTSVSCIQCHEHKYDPFEHRDYYSLMAFFNSTELETEAGSGSSRQFVGPMTKLPQSTEEAAALQIATDQEKQLASKHRRATKEVTTAQTSWEKELREGKTEPADVPEQIRAIVSKGVKQRTAAQKQKLKKHFLAMHPEVGRLQKELAAIRAQLPSLEPTTTLVMRERKESRATHLFHRGNFLDTGEQVEAGVPESLHSLPAGPKNRLTLARWLVSKENPLVARVTVNRAWAELFGRGIVTTLDEFGSQGEPPTHPQLLDYLAVEFMESGWSLKSLHRLMVTSATYRQSSNVSADVRQSDPDNRLLARRARRRLSAEAIRDNGLTVSGLISTKMAGPPVYPVQPDGIWNVTGAVDNAYKQSKGEDQYRRGAYIVWRRSSPYPSFVNFDAPDRASCVVNRARTNTPLQALTLMNDPAYVEMALTLASRVIAETPDQSDEQRVRHAIRICFAREGRTDEVATLTNIYQREHRRLTDDAAKLKQIVDAHELDADAEPAQLAAWWFVATVLMNLDEFVTQG